jgi:hypothetical protein
MSSKFSLDISVLHPLVSIYEVGFPTNQWVPVFRLDCFSLVWVSVRQGHGETQTAQTVTQLKIHNVVLRSYEFCQL